MIKGKVFLHTRKLVSPLRALVRWMLRCEGVRSLRRRLGYVRISLLGWYGFNSTGDDMLEWCIKSLFQKRAAARGMKIKWAHESDCDICVIGGGTIIGCDTSGIVERIERTHSPVAIFGPGFRNTGEEECRLWQPRMQLLFERAVAAGVRGPNTAEALRRYNMAANVEVIGDPAVWFEPEQTDEVLPENSVGICIREMKNVAHEQRYAPSEQVYQKFAELVPIICEELQAEPVFFSFAENPFDSDGEGAQRLRKLLPERFRGARIIPFSADVRRNTTMLGQVGYLLSERMHPTFLAWLMGKPCIMLENQYGKSTDLMAGIGMERFCIRTDDLSVATYIPLMKQLLSDRQNLADEAARQFEHQRGLQSQFVEKVLDYLAMPGSRKPLQHTS